MADPLLRPASPADVPFLVALCRRFIEYGIPPWRDRDRVLQLAKPLGA